MLWSWVVADWMLVVEARDKGRWLAFVETDVVDLDRRPWPRDWRLDMGGNCDAWCCWVSVRAVFTLDCRAGRLGPLGDPQKRLTMVRMASQIR